MKKVFISQPMKDKSNSDILNERDAVIAELEEELGEPFEVIESYAPKNKLAHPLISLGGAIQQLAEANLAVFCKGWEEVRGCKIEHECAIQYGIEVLEK